MNKAPGFIRKCVERDKAIESAWNIVVHMQLGNDNILLHFTLEAQLSDGNGRLKIGIQRVERICTQGSLAGSPESHRL